MGKRLTVVASVLILAVTLSGCSKCGFWWDDWQSQPKSCKGDWPK